MTERIGAARKFFLDFLQAPGPKIVRVSADIEAVAMRLVIEASMDMAEKVPRPVPGAMPLAHRVVAQHDAMPALMDLADVANARKKRGVVSERLLVMIAGDEMDLAVQLPQIGVGAARVPVTEIAEMVDYVGCSDALVPTSDKRLVHLRSACERPPARADNVFVPEMGVGCEKHRHTKSPRKTPPGRLMSKPAGCNARKIAASYEGRMMRCSASSTEMPS